MTIARLHLHDGSEFEQILEPGQTVPSRIRRVPTDGESSTVHTFAYRKGQPLSLTEVHYDEWPAATRVVLTPER